MRFMTATIVARSLLLLALTPAAGVAQTGLKPPPTATADTARRVALPRAYVAIGAGFQTADNDFTDQRTVRVNAEDGQQKLTYAITGAAGADASAGIRVWKQFGIRLGVQASTADTASTLEAQLPHPFFFGRQRTVSADISDLVRNELALNASLLAMVPLSRRLQLNVFAGPTFFQAKQDIISSFTVIETYPFDSASFGSANAVQRSIHKTGFGGGVDVVFSLNRRFGVSGGVSVNQATANVILSADSTGSLTFGGAKAHAGVVFEIR